MIERGNARSWRFLETSGVLDAALPELAAALRRRAGDGISLDGTRTHRLQVPERLRMLDGDDPLALEVRTLEHVDRLLLAAFLIEWLEDEPDPRADRPRLALHRLDLDPADRDAVLDHVRDRNLLWSAVHQPGALSEERVLELAAHLDTPERARALYLLSALRSEGRERWEVQRLRALYELVQATLSDDSLTGGEARSLAERRRADAAALVGDQPGALERLAAAPRAYVLRTPTTALANHARLLDPPPARTPRVNVARADDVGWWIDVAWQDEAGRLAAITKVLSDHQLVVDDGVLATWPDGAVLDSFHVPLGARPDAAALAEDIKVGRRRPDGVDAAPRRRGVLRQRRVAVAHGVRGPVHRSARAAPRAGHVVRGRPRRGAVGERQRPRRTGDRPLRGHRPGRRQAQPRGGRSGPRPRADRCHRAPTPLRAAPLRARARASEA